MRFLFLLVPLGCQSSGADPSAQGKPQATPSGAIEVRDGTGAITARIIPGHPCRATIDNVELQVGTLPLVAQVGATRWSGKLDINGTTIHMDDKPVARMYAASKTEIALFDLEGVALMRAQVTEGTASIGNRQGSIVRTIAPSLPAGGTNFSVTGGVTPLTVSGTTDLLLAAVLTATETSPEVRGLAACHRLFPTEVSPEKFGP